MFIMSLAQLAWINSRRKLAKNTQKAAHILIFKISYYDK